MKIDIENLGGIDKGSIELNDFTIFCGKNNSGKTYAMYLIYGFLRYYSNNYIPHIKFDFVKPVVEALKKEGNFNLDVTKFVAKHQDEIIEENEKILKNYLPNLFGVSDGYFSDVRIKVSLSNKQLESMREKNYLFSIYAIKDGERWTIEVKTIDKEPLTKSYLQIADNSLQLLVSKILIEIIFFDWQEDGNDNFFLLPAERAGINIFFKELFSIRNLLLQQAQNVNVDPMFFLKDIVTARYAEPIKDYLQYLSLIGSTKKETSDYQKYAKKIENDVLGGKYQVDDYGNVEFIPSQSGNTLSLHFSSSTVKTLFGLVFYLEHLAKKGDYLMIDEPELNLHPDNQRQVARVLAQLVNAGLKVIVSTHSDYFVRELNNLIMLKNDFSGAKELQKKYGYQDNELLAGKQVSAYLFDKKTIIPMELDKDEGIIAETFDDVINNLNKSSNEIYYAMQDAKELND